MKKVACLLLALILAFTAFGCGNEGQTQTDPSSNKLRVGIMSNINVTDYDENEYTKYIEQGTGVDIEFVYFPSSSENAIRQITLMAAGTEPLPDVLLGFTGIDPNMRNDYGDAGYFKDLTNLIEQYAPNYKAKLATLSEHEQERINSRGVSESGCFYALPQHFMSVVDDMQSLMYINREWLDTLGLTAPTNIDELYTVLKAFKEKDPNGNGIDDEIPMVSRVSSGIIQYVINAFVYYNSTYPFNVTDGKLWASFTSDEYRQAMIYLNKLCKEGLFSDLTFSMTSSAEAIALNTPANGVSIVGIWTGHPDIVTSRTSPVLKEYEALGYLSDATGKGGYNVIQPERLAWSGIITKDCKNDELAMKFLDFFYLDETVTRGRHGVKDVDWYYEEGKSLFGGTAYINLLNSDVFFKGNHTWCQNMLGIVTDENYLYCDNAQTEVDVQENRLLGGACRVYEQKNAPKEICADLVYTAKEYERKTELASMIDSCITESRSYFILGQLDPNNDNDWNKYLNDLKGYGLDEYLQLLQDVYDENFK